MTRINSALSVAAAAIWARFAVALWTAAVLAAIALPARPAAAQTAPRDIVDTAVGAGQFTTLATAIQAAGLVDTLKGPGPFTVFAPTDAAFAKLPAGTVEALVADPARLRAVLTYHVVPGRVTAADVSRLTSANSVQGEPIRIALSGNQVRLNGSATVTQADIMASNGVIHVIDTVILPPSAASLPRTGAGDGGNMAVLAVLGAGALALTGLVWRQRRGLVPASR